MVSSLGEVAPRLGQRSPCVVGKGRLVTQEDSVSSVVTWAHLTQDPVQMQILTWVIWDEA